MGNVFERSELNALPTKPLNFLNEAVFPDALDPPSMSSTEWETILTEKYDYSDNTKIFQSVYTLPTEFELNPHELSHSNGIGKNQLTKDIYSTT